ncbi:glycosyltransferase [Parasphingopyxis marina]|uniref:Glycosyltransferase n=1 Tax=Parasphingopyxis marina TaxID=2761622 RepID=A0A842HVH5_9SPHN|nr:glycosyltransferase [Parasphingopyxis marina]MBC2778028.1 glycosyltransferase [Parasphingopyxis marina]
MSGWPLPPGGPLAAAIAATRQQAWPDAIDLWRDILRSGKHTHLAAGCIAEAALRTDRRGLADQMLGQFDAVPPHLLAMAEDPGSSEANSPFEFDSGWAGAVTAFRDGHPLGGLLPAETLVAHDSPDKAHSKLKSLFAPRADRVARDIERFLAARDMAVLRDYAEGLIERGSKPDALHWALLGLRKAGVAEEDPLFRRLTARFSAFPLPEDDRALADAHLLRGLGYPALARLSLLDALKVSHSARIRGRIRRRLARLAAERDRWLDDADILSRADFGGETPARDALLEWAGKGGAPAQEPLETAFAWLLEAGLASAQPYDAENRLLMVGNTLGCGGMERMLARAYRHFSASDAFETVDLALLDYADGAPSAFYAEEAGVSAADILLLGRDGPAAMPFALLPGSWKARAQKLHDHVAATRPRVIHAWNDLTGLLAAYAGLAAGCSKIIVHFHHAPGVPLSGRGEPIAAYPAVYRRLRERAEVETLFCAQASANGYARWWRVAQDERFCILYNGFDWAGADADKAQAKQQLGIASDAPVIGTVMRFAPVKQPLVWAEAAISLAAERSDAHFLMVGEGPLREAAAMRFADAGLSERLHMPGQVENVADYLAAMDLFWLSSATEGLPNVLIEAQFSGVPIAAFDVGGVGETFLPDETGALVSAGDSDALAAHSLALLEDEVWMDGASAKAVTQAEERFSATAFFGGLSAHYAG